jgi:tight adherence protein B
MTVIAALCVGACCALAVGARLGLLPPTRVARLRGPSRATVASFGAGAVTLLAVTALSGSVFVALVPAVAVALLPRAYLARSRRHVELERQRAWPDGVRDLLASIAAGRSLTQAVTALAEHGPAPLQTAFARFPQLARMLGSGPALEIVKQELADPTSDRVLEVLLLAHERGGGIVRAILADLVDATTRDVKLLDELETEGLEMRINARAVVVLPWIVLVALTVRPGPFRVFYQSPAGALTLVVAGALTIVGVIVLGRLAREPTEPRVFGGSEAVR